MDEVDLEVDSLRDEVSIDGDAPYRILNNYNFCS